MLEMLCRGATDITANTWTHLEIINSAFGAPAQHDNTGGGSDLRRLSAQSPHL